ncbi:LAMI_0G08812g1_1 [Lachancea mirantina]|uniref:Mediator of RNA polymerase II transcription subunit 31 n=1 Tax=Lachancea mirantina TaxID=1230905 RepID=A0A1G4KA39_9SACH|nr:LAMI_0G08812g1_1 [Lachancea mirantina]
MDSDTAINADSAELQQQVDEPPTRFEVELEFVQCLANIPYVVFLLSQPQIWKDPKFRAYLKYLEYWTRHPYAQCIVYPNCLFVLKLLNGYMENATISEDGMLEGIEELPKLLQSQGGVWMNEMVERWNR